MKYILILLSFWSLSVPGFSQQPLQQVNALLLDESYIAAFGETPNAATDEKLRIQTHLSYVEDRLRKAPSDHLSYDQWMNRMKVLDFLRQYNEAGRFPVNRDYPGERRPCFIDADGNICAVGYLIEQTKGRELAEAINAKHQYDFLLDMNEEVIELWAKEFGLTLEECAMIQPAYGPPPPPETIHADIKTGYGVSSGLLGGGNTAISIANFRGMSGKTLSYIGLATGTGQVIMGIASIKKTTITPVINGGEVYTSYKKQNNLSYANIAVGTATVISSAINLVMQKKNPERRTAFGMYSYPNSSKSVTMGFSFSRRI